MCGISGFLHHDAGRQAGMEVIKRMNDRISHRGPDGEGFYHNQNVALGHRRLAIIDLSTGEQPMYSADRTIALVFNGEIYNYIELREELILLGNHFVTTSDTEVIIQAYRTWGVDCQKRFNGMWAFALWDDDLKRLFVSRDRMGEKPLYYSQSDNSLIFGSELKAVIAYGIPEEPRLDMLELYFTLGFIPSPYTFYKGINQLMPGKCILADSRGMKVETYWHLPDITEKDLVKDKQQVEKDFRHLFNDAVNIRMRSDVAFGAFLSGGLDSSCVVATMANYTSKPVETFTIGFENKEFDERTYARLVAEKFHTNHHEHLVTPDNLDEALHKILHHYDEPFGDPSAIPTGYVSKFAASHVKMVLTGDGGDEVLSGYTIYQGERFARQYQMLPAFIRHMLPYLVKHSARPFRGSVRYKLNRIAKVLSASNQPFPSRLFSKLTRTSKADLHNLLHTSKKQVSFGEFYEETMKGCRFQDPFYKLMHFQLKVTLPDNMLTKVDRMSMAYSIETRTPFLDHRIVELLYGVNKSLKVDGYVNKIILRNTVANDSLPRELLTASKKGFAVPLRDWFKEDNLETKVRSILFTNNDDNIYNSQGISQIIKENKEGVVDKGTFIWMTLVLKRWLDELSVKNSNLF